MILASSWWSQVIIQNRTPNKRPGWFGSNTNTCFKKTDTWCIWVHSKQPAEYVRSSVSLVDRSCLAACGYWQSASCSHRWCLVTSQLSCDQPHQTDACSNSGLRSLPLLTSSFVSSDKTLSSCLRWLQADKPHWYAQGSHSCPQPLQHSHWLHCGEECVLSWPVKAHSKHIHDLPSSEAEFSSTFHYPFGRGGVSDSYVTRLRSTFHCCYLNWQLIADSCTSVCCSCL